MSGIAVIGEGLRIAGYALAGAMLCPAGDQAQALRAWRELPGDVAVVLLTAGAADWLAAVLVERAAVLTVVMPE